MQIRKCLLAVGFAVAALSVQAADTDAQVKAREALQKKLKDIDAAAAVTNAPAPAEPVPPAATAAPAAAAAAAPASTPVEQPTPPQPPAAPAPATPQMYGVPTPADPAVIEKARESMHKKMEELTAAELAADAAAKQAAAQQPPPTKPTEIAKNPSPPANPPANPPSKPPKPKTGLGLEPIEPPPLPISAEKKQQLDALLLRYKADQVTPDQYQAERAKILQGD